MITDVALAHGAAYIKGQRRGHSGSGFVLKHDAPNLRAVAVGNNYLIARCNNIGNVDGGLFDYFELFFSGSGTACFLQGVAAQSDDDLFHRSNLSAA